MERTKIGCRVSGPDTPSSALVLTPEALAFVADLHQTFNATREEYLRRRAQRQAEFDTGTVPDFLKETAKVREADWKVASTPSDLQKRWVEITGPVDRKMMINAFNSGADVFMADFEDALSPTWVNVVEGQKNLIDAVRRTLTFDSGDGKKYELRDQIATLMVRPRGWHLTEKHVSVDGAPISASLFDFGLSLFHNGKELLKRGTGPYFYLPKLESHLEARLWNDVFNYAQDWLAIPRGSIRATVLIETILAAFEMEEILYELRDHSAGLNAGRWDYIFSLIKTFSKRRNLTLPDRAQVTMTVPFMRAYAKLLVQTCHRRGAHAIGGMAAFIPSRRDPEINRVALAKVREDKERESSEGFDGTWIAHPDLVSAAGPVFEGALGKRPHQKDRIPDGTPVAAQDLTNLQVSGGTITPAGLRSNISIALQYLNSWLLGNGAAAIFNLMEDAATAEISRAQLWQWLHNGAKLDTGHTVAQALYEQIRDEELDKLGGRSAGRYQAAAEILDELVRSESFVEFLTWRAYDRLN